MCDLVTYTPMSNIVVTVPQVSNLYPTAPFAKSGPIIIFIPIPEQSFASGCRLGSSLCWKAGTVSVGNFNPVGLALPASEFSPRTFAF